MTPWIVARQASLSITNSRSLLKLMFTELVISSNHLILCCPLILPPSIFPSIRVYSSESLFRIRWPKYWSFSFNISPSNGHSGLISFRINWLDLLAVQGTLKNLLQISPTRRCKSCQYLCSQFVCLVAKSCPILCCQHVCVSCSVVSNSCHPVDCGPPGFSVHGILQQEYWSGLPFLSSEELPNPGNKPWSPALQAGSLPFELQGT